MQNKFSKQILLLGNSGHALVVEDAILSAGLQIAGYFDLQENKNTTFTYLGNENMVDVNKIINGRPVFVSIGSNKIRQNRIEFLDSKGCKSVTIVHNNAYVARNTNIGQFTLVSAGSVVNPNTTIGRGVILNSGSVVEHDSQIGDYSHIGPNATILGGVKIGRSCFVGAGSVIKEGTTIVDNVIIGAGSVVINDINLAGTWVGNPARKIK